MARAARKYQDLLVWQKARRLAKTIYQVTRGFPDSELYGLTTQMRRAAVSIPSNIAEGFGRRSNGEFSRFLLIARGSLFELETQSIIANDLLFLNNEDYARAAEPIDEVERMLDALIRHVEKSR